MGTRTDMLAELAREMLGPRLGPAECLATDPLDEYIVGVLAPDTGAAGRDVDADADLAVDDVSGDSEDDSDSGPLPTSSVASPSLDPKSLPRSIGVSFAVRSEAPSIRICCTWARYLVSDGGWQRRPSVLLTDAVTAQHDRVFPVVDDVRIQMRVRQIGPDLYRISVFLVNVRNQPPPHRPTTTDYVFQPQIRIRLNEPGSVVPLDSVDHGMGTSPDAEEAKLDLLYRQHRGYARGHMCGAVWRGVDPERNAGVFEHTRPDIAPFFWVDRNTAPANEVALFTPADVRSEMLPCFPVEAPATAWPLDRGPAPELRADVLAETWDPAALRTMLEPLPDAYRAWVGTQRQALQGVPNEHRVAAEGNIASCERLAERLDEALGLLTSDSKARLAFCFANKAMAVQAQWNRGQPLEWRPFQLAFLLAAIVSAANPFHDDRMMCDLLWFPTGGGKTEAYLGLAVFVMAYRRLLNVLGGQGDLSCAAGTAVISRYTLRLLTIQQFRRALSVVTACESLRVAGLGTPGGPIGWRPIGCSRNANFLWGTARFSAGLWVGGSVTPNNLNSFDARIGPTNAVQRFVGALEILRGARPGYTGPDQQLARSLSRKRLEISGEPAQVTACPCCHSLLAIPEGQGNGRGLGEGRYALHIPHSLGTLGVIPATRITDPSLAITVIRAETRAIAGGHVTTIEIEIPQGGMLNAQQVDEWWAAYVGPAVAAGDLNCARASRPGYVLIRRNGGTVQDFEIFCPNPQCHLNLAPWVEEVPFSRTATTAPTNGTAAIVGQAHADLPSIQGQWQELPAGIGRLSQSVAARMPIPALTVDDQIFGRCPSLLIATADKFARLSFEPRCASLFGNVSHYHARFGYYREGAPLLENPPHNFQLHPVAGPGGHHALHVTARRFRPPELIIQDELHLMEGALGSMVGLYETAIETLCGYEDGTDPVRPKYVASTATIRQAATQLQGLFDRSLAQFPPSALSSDDSFFAVTREPHPLDDIAPGRLYVGIAAPGKGAQTPIVRIWSSLLQSGFEAYTANPSPDTDRFWTLAAYFNAVRELAGATTLYRQDIPERMQYRWPRSARPLGPDESMELSSRVDSMELPSRLAELERPQGVGVVLATSMFGTGVDIDRLGLMAVHGQPKTTSTYIQATGRVGRRAGALVVTFLRAARPRDLDHYEYFVAYHRALHRYVEAITVSPFAPKARERGLGPLSVALLRQGVRIGGHPVSGTWRVQQRLDQRRHYCEARRMAAHRHDPEVRALVSVIEERARSQPAAIRPQQGVSAAEAQSELDRWQGIARQSNNTDDFVYSEPTAIQAPTRAVVLGDPQHQSAGLNQAFENAPQSLREIEETTTFKT
jgi:hypothetical protein